MKSTVGRPTGHTPGASGKNDAAGLASAPSAQPAGTDELGGLVRALVKNLEVALDDTNDAVDRLTDSVIAMCELGSRAAAFDGTAGISGEFESHSREALRALQFHDLLAQRVRHGCLAMSEIAAIVSGDGLGKDEKRGDALAGAFRDACTSEADKPIFQRVLDARTAHEDRASRAPPANDDVVLF